MILVSCFVITYLLLCETRTRKYYEERYLKLLRDGARKSTYN